MEELRSAGRALAGRELRVMEVCGGQTHAILKNGLDALLPEGMKYLHGPGCPVCVTPGRYLDGAIALARAGATVCSFGDLWRVPSGRGGDLYGAKAEGCDVRMVGSPLEALEAAKREPGREVVFLAIGFETTAPANALALKKARAEGVDNFCEYASQFLVPPALRAICRGAGAGAGPDAILAAGHVCAVTGAGAYRQLAAELGKPVVVTGFSAAELLAGTAAAARLAAAGRAEVFNAYRRVVSEQGNPAGWGAAMEVFETCGREWRGLGWLDDSGLRIRKEFGAWDAEKKFADTLAGATKSAAGGDEKGCEAGKVLVGQMEPPECPLFGTACTPESPKGAPMVSPEGACAAYWWNGRGGGRG